MVVTQKQTITNYKLLTFAGLNNAAGINQFDFNLVAGKRLIIKKILLKWFVIDDSNGYPYDGSITNFDGTIANHTIIKSDSHKIFIPENSSSNIFQDGNCSLIFSINNKPLFLNGKLDNLFINEDNVNINIGEPVQSIIIKVNNAKALLLNGSNLVESTNLGWLLEMGVYII